MSHAALSLQQKNNEVFLNKKTWIFLMGFWFISQMIFLYSDGINPVGESDFRNVVNMVIHGEWNFSPNYYLYFGNIIILIFLKLIGLSNEWAYLVQLFVAAAAFICFIKLLKIILSNSTAIILAAILFCICPFFQSWTCFLSTDSNFANLLIITTYLLVNPVRSEKQKKWLILCLLVLPFFRPVGFLFVAVAIFFWLTNERKKNTHLIFFFSGYFILLVFFSWYCLVYSQNFFFSGHNSEANIICGYPSDLVKYIKEPYDPGKSMFHFLISNPDMTWRLLLNRLFKSFWMTRPFYSAKHDLFIAVALIPYYGFAIIGVGSILRKGFFLKNAYILFGLFIFVVPMLLFCADWVNRFMLAPFVFIFILMSLGINFLFQKFYKPTLKN
jgi:4-amino-4-deoxy-L-arabinose transferase-like glycosyltransferase